jgi:hypothetical protein
VYILLFLDKKDSFFLEIHSDVSTEF